jgi:NADPH:quinone reductase
MRKGEWAEAAPVSGIECVGCIDSCPGGEFAPGTKVAAFMGGLGRTINGSYAEYTCVPVTNVVFIGQTDVPWEALAAIPESYATAWTCLFRNLEIKKGQTLVIRGATSALGQASLNLAVNAGVKVIATTRNKARFDHLQSMGANSVELESPTLSSRLNPADAKGKVPIDCVLNLVGNSVLLDSLSLLRRGGRMCLAGFLGGLAPVPSFDPLSQMPSGVHFSFFGNFQFGKDEFPVSDIPMGEIVKMVEQGKFEAKPKVVFRGLESIVEAHLCMEGNEAGGKVVLVV